MVRKKKQNLIKFTGQLGFSGIFSKILSLPHSIIYAKFLMPSGFGVLQIFKVIISYFGYIQMGMLQAVTRNVPKAYANNNFEKSKNIKDIAFTWLFSLTVIGLFFLWTIYFLNDEFSSKLDLNYLIMLTFIIIVSQLNNFMKPILKAEGEFDIIGKVALINSLSSSIIGIFLVLLFSLEGALLALFINNLIMFTVTIVYYREYIPNLFFRFNMLYEQMSQGLLIFFYRRSEEIIKSLSLIIIAYFYGIETVGVFSFGFLSLSSVYKYSSSIRIYFYREIMLQNKFENKYFKKLFSLPHIFNLFFNSMLLIIFAGIYLIIINLFLPEYLESIPVIYFSLFGLIVFNSRSFCNQFFDATNRLVRLIKYILIGLSVSLPLCIFFSYYRYDIYYIAIACSIGFTLMSVLSIYNAFLIVTESHRESIMMIIKIILISFINSFLIYQLNQIFIFFSNDSLLLSNILALISLFFILLINYFIFSFLFIKDKFMNNFNSYVFKILTQIKVIK